MTRLLPFLLLALAPLCQSIRNQFPTLEDTLEMAFLSSVVYDFWGSDGCNAALLPRNMTCHYYHHDQTQGAQVLVVTSADYICIVFAGTDDLRTSIADGDILLKPFGPLDEQGNSIKIPGPARVHAGFDSAVFEHGLYDTVVEIVNRLRNTHAHYTLFTTGHSLGASNSLLLSVGLAIDYPDLIISNINFGCPRTGNHEWRKYVHLSLQNLSIFRFVQGWDLVARLPEYPFYHVGHTVQLDSDSAKAYYLHTGNTSLDYAGVPMGWGSMPFFWVPGALSSHHIKGYHDYLIQLSVGNEEVRFVDKFELCTPTNDDHPPSVNDDEYVNPPDDALIIEEDLLMMYSDSALAKD